MKRDIEEQVYEIKCHRCFEFIKHVDISDFRWPHVDLGIDGPVSALRLEDLANRWDSIRKALAIHDQEHEDNKWT